MTPSLLGAPGPRRLDPHQAKKVKAKTLVTYQQAGKPFAQWLVAEGLAPQCADSWDDLLVEFKNIASLKKGHFQNLVASVCW